MSVALSLDKLEKKKKRKKKMWAFGTIKKYGFFTLAPDFVSQRLPFCIFFYNLHNHLQVKNIIPTWRHVLIMFVLNYSILRGASDEFDFVFTLGLLGQGYIFVMNHLHWERRICWTGMVYLYIMLQSESILTSLILINEF